jgi:hypothetical protein
VGEKLVLGPFDMGLTTNREPFVIDNNAFPYLVNAYQWRGRIKRKRGTSFLCRLERYFDSTIKSYGNISTLTLSSGTANLFSSFQLQLTGNIVPGSVVINNVTVAQSYTDPSSNGILVGSLGGSGTINYATGDITISGGGSNVIRAKFLYYPGLPVMGIEDFIIASSNFPENVSFDTKYAYQIITSTPYSAYDVSFYKNPATASYDSYVQKTTTTGTSWNGQDYQQFFTTNFQGALWATNGVTDPFDATNIGMQFNAISGIAIITTGPPPAAAATATLTINSHGLVKGDFIFVNEVNGTTGINFQTGYVISADPQNPNTVVVEFPNATLGGVYTSGGIAQYLTSRSDTTKDCIRWYDGDPTNGSPTSPGFIAGQGWVNFCPPLSQAAYPISANPSKQYYLVGAKMIVPFKDRLLFLGPVIQTSSANSQIYLPDTVIYSQVGTPYYTASFSGAVDSTSTTFNAILVPTGRTATATAWWEDVTGYGGFITAGYAQKMNTVSSNQDSLIIGFDVLQARLLYTSSDISPFNFYIINSEYGSSSTFSAINLDQGVLARGDRGFIMTSQTDCNRFDLSIPDQSFEIKSTENGNERITAQRDFINEWVYFTYPSDNLTNKFPNETLFFNYRDNSWGVFQESYTTYGQFRKADGFVWSTVDQTYASWAEWTDPWDAGVYNQNQPLIACGNQQGFILVRDQGTGEGTSISITSFASNVVTSPNHCLRSDDFIIITDCIGTISSDVNGKIFQVLPIDEDSFYINEFPSGAYVGGGLITKMYVPYIQTKQFPTAWGIGRKTRIGAQQYLFTTTQDSQITLLIFLSQNSSNPYNDSRILPDDSVNNGLIYSTVLYTCPESTNLGLTPANTNLQMPNAQQQAQIWHRMNTSLIGDTVQIGLTLSDDQMEELTTSQDIISTITGITLAYPCVITTANEFDIGQLILISDVMGTTELNGNVYIITDRSDSSITIDVDATGFTPYTSGGTATLMTMENQFAEIEFHGAILDMSPSMMLC